MQEMPFLNSYLPNWRLDKLVIYVQGYNRLEASPDGKGNVTPSFDVQVHAIDILEIPEPAAIMLAAMAILPVTSRRGDERNNIMKTKIKIGIFTGLILNPWSRWEWAMTANNDHDPFDIFRVDP